MKTTDMDNNQHRILKVPTFSMFKEIREKFDTIFTSAKLLIINIVIKHFWHIPEHIPGHIPVLMCCHEIFNLPPTLQQAFFFFFGLSILSISNSSD